MLRVGARAAGRLQPRHLAGSVRESDLGVGLADEVESQARAPQKPDPVGFHPLDHAHLRRFLDCPGSLWPPVDAQSWGGLRPNSAGKLNGT